MAIGTNIKKIRENKNISFDEMVKKLRVFRKYYSLVENNIQKPNSNLLIRIAKVLNVSSDDIVNYNDEASVLEQTRLDLKNLKYKELNKRTSSLEAIKIGETTYIPLKKPTVREVISQKPQLLNREDIVKYGNNIKLVGLNDILPGTITKDISNPFEGLTVDKEKPSSPRILNWVEPYKYKGKNKTLFYTEVNTGFKVGDRIFIINGFYDSNNLIVNNKYRRTRDGYKVIFVDNCKIALDIDYTGNLPYVDSPNDDFINLYVIEGETDFKYFNRQITTRDDNFDYKFNPGQNTIVYSENNYTRPITGWGESEGLFGAPGFFVKNGTQSWTNITNDFISGSFSIAENLAYNSKKEVKVINGNFTYSINNEVVEFKENKIYKWDDDLSNWKLSADYNQALMTKSNFRNGNFKGEWNSGVFGSQDRKLKWEGSPAVWNLGTLLNTEWVSGEINSIYTLPVSYISEFEGGEPYQKLNGPNNNGWGYNYLIDSDINLGTVKNGNIENTTLGNPVTFSTIENYLIGTQSDYKFEIEKALIKSSYLISGFVKDSDVVNSRSLNTRFENIKSVNSSYKNSLIKDSKYLSDDNIKILDYEELSLNVDSSVGKASHKVYRFYISPNDYDKLRLKDRFYIKGLRLNDNSKYPLNFFNKRFKLSTWVEYLDFYAGGLNLGEYFYKRGIEMACFISTPKDNEWLYNSYSINPTTFTTRSIKKSDDNLSNYSIDIFVSLRDIDNSMLVENSVNVPNSEISNYGLSINNNLAIADSSNEVLTTKIRDVIDISEAFIVNSDFESGLMETTDWISGNNINYNNDVNINDNSIEGGVYNIMPYTASSTLKINTKAKWFLNSFEVGDDCLEEGNIVFLNNVTYTSNDGSEIVLGDTYKIINDDYKTTGSLTLEEIGTNTISTLPDTNGTFSTPEANNRYGYIHKSKIDSSKIKSGIFRRSYITNSLIENDDYDITDKSFNDLPLIKSLVISDSIFKNTGNILSKATYLHTSFVNGSDQFNQGIVFRSLWNGMTFSDGVFKESTWLYGTFESGAFYNNRSFKPVTNTSAIARGSLYQAYDTDRVKTYYKDGLTTATISNNRFSWRSGDFIGGEFLKSNWENGTFSNGEFLISNFYNGLINGGIIGNSNLKSDDTKIYNAEINQTTVENARLIASDPNINGLSSSNINWYNGTFNNGVFGSDTSQGATNSAIWQDGIFNGGEFSSMAKWKNGIFNGGKFTSGLGWTMSKDNTIQSEYAWEDGVFNGGIFGNESTGTNSTWYDGIFNGGKFVGRIWNDGIFQYGTFEGSGKTYSAIINNDNKEPSSNASIFNDSFSQSYYGLWKNGVVDNTLVNNSTDLLNQSANMRNLIWESGTFSHLSGVIENSLWLDGAFIKGNFRNSSFNPFVKRNGATESSFNLNDNTCYWKNGDLHNSDFYISEWMNGSYNLGNSFGMIWKDGTCEYMNAYNIFWENGLWKNGNWNGSYISYDGGVNDEFESQLLLRGASWSGINDIHIWNVFQESNNEVISFDSQGASEITGIVRDPSGDLFYELKLSIGGDKGLVCNETDIVHIIPYSGNDLEIGMTINVPVNGNIESFKIIDATGPAANYIGRRIVVNDDKELISINLCVTSIISAISLSRSIFNAESACSIYGLTSNEYFIDVYLPSLYIMATKLYDTPGGGFSPPGWYSDGTISRYWDGESFGDSINC